MTATNETLSMATEAQLKRDLPQSIVVPPIRGEMVHLRPATVEDLPRLDELDAFYGASKITGKDAVTERAIVHTWVRRSQAWEAGQAPAESGVGDPESRRTIAWAVLTDADHDDDGQLDAASTDNVIGMIFLIDIDGWSKSARIQIILGREYRGRGYSRDAMPRVMNLMPSMAHPRSQVRMRSPNAPSYTRGSAAPRLGKPVRHPPNPVWVIRNPAAPSHGPY